MADELYAWSPIEVGGEDGKREVIAQGTKVTASAVGGKDELENLRRAGVVRTTKFPDDVGMGETPMEARLRQIRGDLAEAGSSPEAIAQMELAAEAANPPPVEEVERSGSSG